MNKEIEKVFGNKLRVRASGICIRDNSVLLVKHNTLGPAGILWAPPGGGIDFNESAEETLMREFEEETGLRVRIKKFLFVHEYLNKPLHAVELFFEVEIVEGELKKGIDPEMSEKNQIIADLKFVDYQDILNGNKEEYHNILTICQTALELTEIKGYFIFKPEVN